MFVCVRDGTVGVNKQYRLTAGQRLWIDRQSGVGTQSSVAPTEVAGWINGTQFFENASVAQVVEQLDRYQRGWIVIKDPALANKRVTGLYDMRDTRRALQALVRASCGMSSEMEKKFGCLHSAGS